MLCISCNIFRVIGPPEQPIFAGWAIQRPGQTEVTR